MPCGTRSVILFQLLSQMHTKIERKCRIGLLGASFDTGNMGVGALAESSVKCILHRWPDAEVTLLDSGRLTGEHLLRMQGKDLRIVKLPVRFCRNVFLGNHFVVLCFYGFLFKVFRGKRFRNLCTRRNASLNCIAQMDMVADITGGDSFSDIYGMRRFSIGFLRKWLVLLFGKDLIMLPQTYGPYNRYLARVMARYILKRAQLIYSRDRTGKEFVNKLLHASRNGKVRFVPDVAFVLDSYRPNQLHIKPSMEIRKPGSILIGVNVSGLLYNNDNNNIRFNLRSDYKELISDVMEMLLADKQVNILLIPHVFPPKENEYESDPIACSQIYRKLNAKYDDRVFLVQEEYDHTGIKYIIGCCDFVLGSRMHACIAALSQGIPAVGLAYSDKFEGVFESIGENDCVVDLRYNNVKQILLAIKKIFSRRDKIRRHLIHIMPEIRLSIMSVLDTISI